MKAFTNYLCAKGNIKQNHIPFYLKWVSDTKSIKPLWGEGQANKLFP